MVETCLASSKLVAKSKKIVRFDSDFAKEKECEVKMGRKSVCKSDKKEKNQKLYLVLRNLLVKINMQGMIILMMKMWLRKLMQQWKTKGVLTRK